MMNGAAQSLLGVFARKRQLEVDAPQTAERRRSRGLKNAAGMRCHGSEGERDRE